jgi:hypothetical protein
MVCCISSGHFPSKVIASGFRRRRLLRLNLPTPVLAEPTQLDPCAAARYIHPEDIWLQNQQGTALHQTALFLSQHSPFISLSQ